MNSLPIFKHLSPTRFSRERQNYSQQLQAMQQALAEKDKIICQLLENVGDISLNDNNGLAEASQTHWTSKPRISKDNPPNKGQAPQCTLSGPSKHAWIQVKDFNSYTSCPDKLRIRIQNSHTKEAHLHPMPTSRFSGFYGKKKSRPSCPQTKVYHRFSDVEQIQNVADNSSLPAIPFTEIETFKQLGVVWKNIGQGLVHVEETLVQYSCSCLARMGVVELI
ncbi:hypothetical protein VP01_1449g8 [Puccinia sorghi]|uniref:Uncharacterized protein n=1 Tax=Puccinia sorghi TaxID=27349 RepID=A0A0L6VK30_9BASI|nr:hypothetical protein VP01_1449g8 [Puccinia sorghi]